MYLVREQLVKRYTDKGMPYHYMDDNGTLACALYNASLYRIRQIFTGWDKENRSTNETWVFHEVDILQVMHPEITVRRVISYNHLEKLMRATDNPAFFAGLPMQTAQAVVKQAVNDFKNWMSALKEYKKSPDKFLGKPKMPGYKKKQTPCTFTLTNQARRA